MQTLYNDNIAKLYASLSWPKGLRSIITEDEFQLHLVFFRDNFDAFDGEDRLHISALVREFIEKVRSMGVPIYLEVRKGNGLR